MAEAGSRADENHLQKELPTLKEETLRTSLIWVQEKEKEGHRWTSWEGTTPGGREMTWRPTSPGCLAVKGGKKKQTKEIPHG